MRIGLIADIHGNLFALTRVLNEFRRLDVQEIVCLGDIATPGPWPSESLMLLDKLDVPRVMGNTDEWLLEDEETVVSDVPEMNGICKWAASSLDNDTWFDVAELPDWFEMDVGDGISLLMFHGSPRSNIEVISERTPSAEVVAALAGFEATVYAGGHTHVQMIRDLDSALMVNPGSVGLGGTGPGTPDMPPVQPASTADFAIIEIADGQVATELYRLPLDVATMLKAAKTTGMPHLDWWASLWSQ